MKRIHLNKKMTFLPALSFASLFRSTFSFPPRHLQILMPRDKVLGIRHYKIASCSKETNVTTEIKKHAPVQRTNEQNETNDTATFFSLSIGLVTCKDVFTLNDNRFPSKWVGWWTRTKSRTSYLNFSVFY